MKNVKIRNEWFEVIKPRKHVVEYAYPSKWDYANVWQAYDKPSYAKEKIWCYWDNFYGDDVYRFGVPFISSKNTFTFTITFNVFDKLTDEWVGVAIITAAHNRLYLA